MPIHHDIHTKTENDMIHMKDTFDKIFLQKYRLCRILRCFEVGSARLSIYELRFSPWYDQNFRKSRERRIQGHIVP